MAERNPKGSANVVRRTWDKDKYEQKAKDREEYGDEHVDKPTTNDDEGIRDVFHRCNLGEPVCVHLEADPSAETDEQLQADRNVEADEIDVSAIPAEWLAEVPPASVAHQSSLAACPPSCPPCSAAPSPSSTTVPLMAAVVTPCANAGVLAAKASRTRRSVRGFMKKCA